MGCDIHGYIEIKIGNTWVAYKELDVRRDYRLFAILANVRNYEEFNIKPISEPRGLPLDVSVLAKASSDGWDSDGHSHSWISCAEIEDIAQWLNKTHMGEPSPNFIIEYDYDNGDLFNYYTEPRVSDVRMVFWFDN